MTFVAYIAKNTRKPQTIEKMSSDNCLHFLKLFWNFKHTYICTIFTITNNKHLLTNHHCIFRPRDLLIALQNLKLAIARHHLEAVVAPVTHKQVVVRVSCCNMWTPKLAGDVTCSKAAVLGEFGSIQ